MTVGKTQLTVSDGLWRQGLWDNNPALVQLLGLCPLLAVSNTTVNALTLGFATLCTLLISNLCASLLRPVLKPEIRIVVFVLIISSIVTSLELFIHAWSHDLYQRLGIFLPLIVTNCAILARAESYASKQRPILACIDGLAQGLGFCIVLVILGSVRELIGNGSVLSKINLLLPFIQSEGLQVFDNGFLLAALAPGAFICLGLLLALRNHYQARNTLENNVEQV